MDQGEKNASVNRSQGLLAEWTWIVLTKPPHYKPSKKMPLTKWEMEFLVKGDRLVGLGQKIDSVNRSPSLGRVDMDHCDQASDWK